MEEHHWSHPDRSIDNQPDKSWQASKNTTMKKWMPLIRNNQVQLTNCSAWDELSQAILKFHWKTVAVNWSRQKFPLTTFVVDQFTHLAISIPTLNILLASSYSLIILSAVEYQPLFSPTLIYYLTAGTCLLLLLNIRSVRCHHDHLRNQLTETEQKPKKWH